MIKRLVRTTLDRAGLEIRRKPALPPTDSDDQDDECARLIEVVRKNTMVVDEGLVSLYHQALFCETHGIPGAYVECGVWKGGAVGLMALVNLQHGVVRRNIHLFDSFQEICEPDETIDGERAVREVKMWSKNGGTQGNLVPLKGVYDHRGGPGTLEENRALLEVRIGYDPACLHYHPGWFQDVLPAEAERIGQIAILRIDADWYASTKTCLEHLFEKVVSGGFVIVDDYGAYDGCRKAVDEFLGRQSRPLYLHPVNAEIRYLVVP